MIKLRLWQVGESDKAYCFSTVPDDPARDGDKVWLPKSQLEHISRRKPAVGTWPECEVTMPEWLAEDKGLI